MSIYICPICKKELFLFETIIDLGYRVEEWRCNACEKELYLAFDKNYKIIKEISCWTDYYGHNRIYLVELNEKEYLK